MADEDDVAVTLLEQVKLAMDAWPALSADRNSVIVPTHCLFHGGGVIRVRVQAASDDFTVDDGGAAIDEFSSNGGSLPNCVRLLKGAMRKEGLHVTDAGVIISPRVQLHEIAPAVATVANATRDAEALLMGRWKPSVTRDFRKELERILATEFSHIRDEVVQIGESTRQHRFDYSIRRRSGGLLLIDAVHRDANAINSAAVRNLDLRNRGLPGVEQRIVYDEQEGWSAADLNLVSIGAKAVPFSAAREVIDRLAA